MNQSKVGQVLKLASNHRTHLVFSSNTDVGKTLITAGLARASLLDDDPKQPNHKSLVQYLKPLQAGVDTDADFIHANVNGVKRVLSDKKEKKDVVRDKVECTTLFSWDTPQSPHWCCREENKPVKESDVLGKISDYLRNTPNSTGSKTFIETAGGVLSPGPSSPFQTKNRHAGYTATKGGGDSNAVWGWSTQADLYSSLGIPALMIGDGHLGGISSTLSSLESLIIRGYDIDMIAVIQGSADDNDNVEALREYISQRLFQTRSGSGKPLLTDPLKDIVSIPAIPPPSQSLTEWYRRDDVVESFHNMHVRLNEKWDENIAYKESILKDGVDHIWWPFTQHAVEEGQNRVLVDRASGDYYSVLSLPTDKKEKEHTLEQTMLFDGPASWWTQGLGHGESSTALSIAAAAGRYSHVLFPSLLNEPAVTLSKHLVSPSGPGHLWAQRAFYSDDGSTAVEVAIKMALKLYETRFPSNAGKNLTCIAHEDCYHGDTLGAMNIAVPSIFNEGQQPWFQSKGCFLKSPAISFQDGNLTISFDNEAMYTDTEKDVFERCKKGCKTINDIYNVEGRLKSQEELYLTYRSYIRKAWTDYEQSDEKPTIAFTFIEPLVLGAGGMKFIDPLYQRALLDESISRNIPVVYDEIFTGLYRLGPTIISCKDVLGVNPDVGCYSKLLTGGLVPLGVTLASKEVFDCFLGDDKASALLHGHSYTAYPVGCISAIHALETYQTYFSSNHNSNKIYFDEEDVWHLSTLPLIQESFTLGTVLVVKVHPRGDNKEGNSGYGANSSRTGDIVKSLRNHGIYARPLGNVIYLMVSPLTDKKECESLCSILGECIREVVHEEEEV